MKKNIFYIAVLSLIIFIFAITPVLAQGLGDSIDQQSSAFIGQTGLSETATPSVIVAQIIKAFLQFLGVIFIVLIIYAGFTWMTSAGNEEKVGKAKKIIIAAVIGLALVLSAYAITVFVTNKFLSATVQQSFWVN